MVDLTVYFHRLRATSEEEIEGRMRKRYPRAAILVRRKHPSELPGYREYGPTVEKPHLEKKQQRTVTG